MRETEFRGKRIDNGEWIYGYFQRNPRTIALIYCRELGGSFEVELKTVGQYTGLKDKNGVEIYEGDIVRLSYGIPPISDNLVIEYADNETIADISVSGWWMRNIRDNGCSSSLCKTYENDLEIIGNIHEHKELLEATNDN